MVGIYAQSVCDFGFDRKRHDGRFGEMELFRRRGGEYHSYSGGTRDTKRLYVVIPRRSFINVQGLQYVLGEGHEKRGILRPKRDHLVYVL